MSLPALSGWVNLPIRVIFLRCNQIFFNVILAKVGRLKLKLAPVILMSSCLKTMTNAGQPRVYKVSNRSSVTIHFLFTLESALNYKLRNYPTIRKSFWKIVAMRLSTSKKVCLRRTLANVGTIFVGFNRAINRF